MVQQGLLKSLVNRLYLKQALYSFRMTESRTVPEQLDVFNKLIQDLENIDVETDDKDQAMMLLCSLPNSYDSFKDTLLYGRESLSMSDVKSALSSKELKEKNREPSSNGGGLYVKSSRAGKGEGKESRGRSKSRSKAGNLKCFFCKKEGHIKRNCPEKLRKQREEDRSKEAANVAISDGEYDTGEALVISDNSHEVLAVADNRLESEWILDSGCSFHMTPNRAWF